MANLSYLVTDYHQIFPYHCPTAYLSSLQLNNKQTQLLT